MVRRLTVTLGILWSLTTAPAIQAHAQSTSYLIVDGAAQPVELRWDLSLHDLVWSVFVDSDFDGVASTPEIEAARPAIGNAVLAQIFVSRGGARCQVRVRDFAPVTREAQPFLAVALVADCPRDGPLTLGGPLFMTGDPSQRVLVSERRGADAITGVISAAAPTWTRPERPSAVSSFVRFIGEGVWHVAIGYDHIAFVLLLLLPSVMRPVAGRWRGAEGLGPVARELVTIVTAFTVAHSITLSLAVTNTVTLPTQPIEVAIAASIAMAAVLNLMPRLSGWRLPLAFGFGLVHGFGFANALREIDAAGTALLPLLAGFNVGVELAQLALVALVLPVIYSMRATRWYAGGLLPLGSCALGAAGLVWMVQRL